MNKQLRHFVKRLVSEALGEENISHQEVVELFKAWHNKFFVEWRKEQFESLVDALVYKSKGTAQPIPPAGAPFVVQNFVENKNLLVPKVISDGPEQQFVVYHERNKSLRDFVISYNKRTQMINYKFGYWDENLTPKEVMGIGGIKRDDTQAARLKNIEVPYSVFKAAVNTSLTLSALKTQMLQYENVSKQKPS